MKFYVESVVNKSDLEDGFTIEENVFFQDEKIVIIDNMEYHLNHGDIVIFEDKKYFINHVVSGRYVYDLEITSNTGIVTRSYEGIVTVTPEVTK